MPQIKEMCNHVFYSMVYDSEKQHLVKTTPPFLKLKRISENEIRSYSSNKRIKTSKSSIRNDKSSSDFSSNYQKSVYNVDDTSFKYKIGDLANLSKSTKKFEPIKSKYLSYKSNSKSKEFSKSMKENNLSKETVQKLKKNCFHKENKYISMDGSKREGLLKKKSAHDREIGKKSEQEKFSLQKSGESNKDIKIKLSKNDDEKAFISNKVKKKTNLINKDNYVIKKRDKLFKENHLKSSKSYNLSDFNKEFKKSTEILEKNPKNDANKKELVIEATSKADISPLKSQVNKFFDQKIFCSTPTKDFNSNSNSNHETSELYQGINDKSNPSKDNKDKVKLKVKDKMESKAKNKMEPKDKGKVEHKDKDKMETKGNDQVEPKVQDKMKHKEQDKLKHKEQDKLKHKNQDKVELKDKDKVEPEDKDKVEFKDKDKMKPKKAFGLLSASSIELLKQRARMNKWKKQDKSYNANNIEHKGIKRKCQEKENNSSESKKIKQETLDDSFDVDGEIQKSVSTLVYCNSAMKITTTASSMVSSRPPSTASFTSKDSIIPSCLSIVNKSIANIESPSKISVISNDQSISGVHEIECPVLEPCLPTDVGMSNNTSINNSMTTLHLESDCSSNSVGKKTSENSLANKTASSNIPNPSIINEDGPISLQSDPINTDICALSTPELNSVSISEANLNSLLPNTVFSSSPTESEPVNVESLSTSFTDPNTCLENVIVTSTISDSSILTSPPAKSSNSKELEPAENSKAPAIPDELHSTSDNKSNSSGNTTTTCQYDKSFAENRQIARQLRIQINSIEDNQRQNIQYVRKQSLFCVSEINKLQSKIADFENEIRKFEALELHHSNVFSQCQNVKSRLLGMEFEFDQNQYSSNLKELCDELTDITKQNKQFLHLKSTETPVPLSIKQEPCSFTSPVSNPHLVSTSNEEESPPSNANKTITTSSQCANTSIVQSITTAISTSNEEESPPSNANKTITTSSQCANTSIVQSITTAITSVINCSSVNNNASVHCSSIQVNTCSINDLSKTTSSSQASSNDKPEVNVSTITTDSTQGCKMTIPKESEHSSGLPPMQLGVISAAKLSNFGGALLEQSRIDEIGSLVEQSDEANSEEIEWELSSDEILWKYIQMDENDVQGAEGVILFFNEEKSKLNSKCSKNELRKFLVNVINKWEKFPQRKKDQYNKKSRDFYLKQRRNLNLNKKNGVFDDTLEGERFPEISSNSDNLENHGGNSSDVVCSSNNSVTLPNNALQALKNIISSCGTSYLNSNVQLQNVQSNPHSPSGNVNMSLRNANASVRNIQANSSISTQVPLQSPNTINTSQPTIINSRISPVLINGYMPGLNTMPANEAQNRIQIAIGPMVNNIPTQDIRNPTGNNCQIPNSGVQPNRNIPGASPGNCNNLQVPMPNFNSNRQLPGPLTVPNSQGNLHGNVNIPQNSRNSSIATGNNQGNMQVLGPFTSSQIHASPPVTVFDSQRNPWQNPSIQNSSCMYTQNFNPSENLSNIPNDSRVPNYAGHNSMPLAPVPSYALPNRLPPPSYNNSLQQHQINSYPHMNAPNTSSSTGMSPNSMQPPYQRMPHTQTGPRPLVQPMPSNPTRMIMRRPMTNHMQQMGNMTPNSRPVMNPSAIPRHPPLQYPNNPSVMPTAQGNVPPMMRATLDPSAASNTMTNKCCVVCANQANINCCQNNIFYCSPDCQMQWNGHEATCALTNK